MGYYWERKKEPDPTVQFKKPADPNDLTYHPQIGGQVFRTDDAVLREDLLSDALAKEDRPGIPLEVLRPGTLPLKLKKEGDWKTQVRAAIEAGQVIERPDDPEIEFVIARESRMHYELVAARARDTEERLEGCRKDMK